MRCLEKLVEREARKTNNMARHSNKKKEPINIMSWDARERTTWRNATVDVARGRTRVDGKT